jgi:formylglycine-generating enzyme required for sulfatase activity
MPSNFKSRNLPVENVSWDDAQEFVNRLSRKTGKNYRLPSEAEWEYSARAGSQTGYSFAENENELRRFAWLRGNSDNTTHPVGEKLPNSFGLHDMIGNVWEWTQDCWNVNYLGAPSDGSAWTNGSCLRRVLRGGSWFSYFQWSRVTSRNGYDPGVRDRYGGFRVARTP